MTVMEPITLILDALAAGAGRGLTDAAATALGDTYTALKNALKHAFAGKPAAETILAEYTKDPDTYDKPLAKQLTDHGVADNQHILDLAQKILDMAGHIDPPGTKYIVDARGARNVQTGDHNTQTNN